MGSPKISVISASKRPDRLGITEKCLANQTHKSFEWIVISPEKHNFGKFIQDPPKDKGDVYALNKAINAGIKASKGELLILLQDSIWIPPDALAKFWFYYKDNPNYCVSGVGDQYLELDDNGKPSNKVWLDPRKKSTTNTFYECNPEDWETNYASLPKHLIVEIGGWDEKMDKYYAWDNVAIAYRLDTIGAKFYLDQTNESFSLKHGRSSDWDKNNWIDHGLWEYLRTRPVKLDYLTEK